MLESQLNNLKLQDKDVDTYVNSMIEIGSKLGHDADTLTGAFPSGIQNDDLKMHVFGTNNYTLDNYRQRAKLYLSAHPTAYQSARSAAAPAVHSNLVALITETTNAFKDLAKDFIDALDPHTNLEISHMTEGQEGQKDHGKGQGRGLQVVTI